MGNSELLPCPFCGGNDVHVGWTDFDSGVIFVECESCGMFCEPKDCYANEPKAIAAWNMRAETRAERDLRDEVNWMHAELHGAEMAASERTCHMRLAYEEEDADGCIWPDHYECGECGAKVGGIMPYCDTEIPPKFCPNCGAKVVES